MLGMRSKEYWRNYRAGREYISERIIPRENYAATKSKLTPSMAQDKCDKHKLDAEIEASRMTMRLAMGRGGL